MSDSKRFKVAGENPKNNTWFAIYDSVNERLMTSKELAEFLNSAVKDDLDRAYEQADLSVENQKLRDELASERGRLRPPLRWFVEQMEHKLAGNDHKGGWDKESLQHLYDRLVEESRELKKEMHKVKSLDEPSALLLLNIISEAADVANFSMMIADVVQAKMPECAED